ncbi:MAG: hypothetical protein KIT31_31060, partial [Deltaproteobacteria bacterium]|nr:hypothetical protein [Deltaproteobacteria bacterium]
APSATPAQLADMEKKRPWDQFVVLALAKDELAKGKVDAAGARLEKLGAPGLMVRDVRYLLGRVLSTQGKLERARQLLASLLGPRLVRFAAASAALESAAKRIRERLARTPDALIPAELRRKLETAGEVERGELVTRWFSEQLDADPEIRRNREGVVALADVVPAALAIGSVELRLAQGLTGAAREAMLKSAERTFLAIRNEAEGQPVYRLGLGEIFARLGKHEESEAEFAAVLAMKDTNLAISLARTYRDLGNGKRAKEVAANVYEHAGDDKEGKSHKAQSAMLLSLLAGDEVESETWLVRSQEAAPSAFAKISLLEVEARKLSRQGKNAACAAKFAEAAKAWLGQAGSADTAGFNNAALAYQHGFGCSGDVAALARAEEALEKAYRVRPEEPIVVGNLANSLVYVSQVRLLAKRIDVRLLRLDFADTELLVGALLDSPERESVLAELLADAGQRRSVDLLAQFEVLAPSSAHAYQLQLLSARRRRDPAAVTAVVERARRAKIDTSELEASRERQRSGADDAKRLEEAASDLERLEEALARSPDARTKAAVRYLESQARLSAGLYRKDAAMLARARDAARAAMVAWPAIDANDRVVTALIDEAGLAADGDAWLALRRARSAIAALAKAPGGLADKIKASPQWREVATYARADRGRASIDRMRLARLLGDAELEKRASAVFDDPIARMIAELNVVLSPNEETAADDLAFFAKR